jgi:penicillin-binding protein 1B
MTSLANRRDCGGSTLTQQLAKNFFLTPDKKISRKIAELMITYQLEARFSKQQIFEMYANEMNLVHRGSYEIDGVARRRRRSSARICASSTWRRCNHAPR